MRDLIFYLGSEMILVKIEGHKILFGNQKYGAKLATIEGLKLSEKGVIKTFPDLKDNPEWREIAIKRFHEHIKTLDKEEDIKDYIVKELTEWGYIPKYQQRKGFRIEKLVKKNE